MAHCLTAMRRKGVWGLAHSRAGAPPTARCRCHRGRGTARRGAACSPVATTAMTLRASMIADPWCNQLLLLRQLGIAMRMGGSQTTGTRSDSANSRVKPGL